MQTISTQTRKPTSNLEVLQQLTIATEDINKCFLKAQSSAYPGKPTAETFFQLQLRFTSDQFSHISTQIKSGKYLPIKSTLVAVTNNYGDTLDFGFHNNKIAFSVNGEYQEIDYTPKGNPQAYENVLEMLYLSNHDLFISPDVAMEALRIITPVVAAKDVVMHKYEPGNELSL